MSDPVTIKRSQVFQIIGATTSIVAIIMSAVVYFVGTPAAIRKESANTENRLTTIEIEARQRERRLDTTERNLADASKAIADLTRQVQTHVALAEAMGEVPKGKIGAHLETRPDPP